VAIWGELFLDEEERLRNFPFMADEESSLLLRPSNIARGGGGSPCGQSLDKANPIDWFFFFGAIDLFFSFAPFFVCLVNFHETVTIGQKIKF